MKFTKKMLLCAAAAALMLLTACDESEPISSAQPSDSAAVSTTPGTTADPDLNAPTDEKLKELGTDLYTPDGNSGKIVWLGYYDLKDDGSSAEHYKIFTSELYGGEVEYQNCSSGSAYFERLGQLIAADESPDIVRYEWRSFPGGMSKNMYEALDDDIDINSPLWAGMLSAIEDFAYNGKHYYFPYCIKSNYAINYNRKALEEYSLPDPYDLYMENNWTWDTFKELLISWCNVDESHIGYIGDSGMSFIATTGTTLIEVKPDGTAVNNINDGNVARAMAFCSSLYHDGLVHQGELGDWVSPQMWANNTDRVLFYGLDPTWVYPAATAEIQNKQGVENDVFNTVSDFAFVPFPRDPSSDTYTIAYDTFGYLVPKGAKNKKGAIDWIHLTRVYETDEGVIATRRQDAVSPTPIYYTSGKYEGFQKWQITWDEQVYDLLQDMTNPEKFNFVFDDCWGFSDELNTVCNTVLGDPMFAGESFTQLSQEYAPVIDSIIS